MTKKENIGWDDFSEENILDDVDTQEEEQEETEEKGEGEQETSQEDQEQKLEKEKLVKKEKKEEKKEVKQEPKAEDLVSTTQALVDELKKQNAEYKALLERVEKLKVVELLSGKSVAEKPKTQDDIYTEKANRLLNRFKKSI